MLLKELRTSAGITQIGFASRMGVSKQHIMRIEQGLYQHIPDNILDGYSALSASSQFGFLTATEIERRYENEVQIRFENLRSDLAERAQNAGGWQNFHDTLQPQPRKGRRHGQNLRNLQSFLGFNSRIEFCKTLAVHPATVLNYEKGLARRLPRDLEQALRVSGVPVGVINAL
jgi:transcriptional regulator with XRE-family HTH domain